MKRPWLSVIIPTYNGGTYLPHALNSILLQGNSDIECIAVDDGSTDNTLEILKAYQDKIPIRILQKERQGNWVTSTNYALSFARSEYICFLHQDDLWLESRLLTIKNLIDKFPQIGFFLHPSQFIDTKSKQLGLWRCPLPVAPCIINSEIMVERLLVQNFISIPSPVFKREIVLNVGGLDETLWYTADWDLWLKIASCSDALYYPEALSAFRIHSASQTVVRSSYLRDFQEQLEIVAQKHLELWNVSKKTKKKIWQISTFSIDVNTLLAGMIHGHNKTRLINLLITFLTLGPSGWYQYFRDSRIVERVSARLKAQLNKEIRI
jgi:glycosyltransferase involved in cell wall biosynthesis